MTATETSITATELARNLSDILNRVKYRGDRFLVERNGERIAVLAPSTSQAPRLTWGEFAAIWPELPRPDEGFADDLEAIQRSQLPLPTSPWDS